MAAPNANANATNAPHATPAAPAPAEPLARSAGTALLKQDAINQLAAVPGQLHTFVRCSGKNCKHGGVIPSGMTPLITCQGACVATWNTAGTRKDDPVLNSAIGLLTGEAVDGFTIKPDYRGACTFCPDCYQAGAHKVACLKPGVPEQCIACVGAYEAEEAAAIKPADPNKGWMLRELKDLGDAGMVCFPLLSRPLPGRDLGRVNDLAHTVSEAAEALKNYESEAAGNPPGEDASGDVRWFKRNFNISANEMRTLMDTLHARMNDESSLKGEMAKWCAANPAKARGAGAVLATPAARRAGAIRRAANESDDEEEAQVDDEALTDLRKRLQVASEALDLAKNNVEAKAAELGEAREKLGAATDRAAKKSAAAAAGAGGASRPKAMNKGTSKGAAKAGPKKTISKKQHEELEKKFKRQRWQAKTRHKENQRMLAVIAAERKWINDFLETNMSESEAAQMKAEFEQAMNAMEVDWEMTGEKNPDESDYDPNEADSDDESEGEGEDEDEN